MRSPAPTRNCAASVEAINDRRALEKLAEIEKSEGRKARYHVEALMIQAKRVLRAEDATNPDVAAITQALNEYEEHHQGGRTVFGLRRRREDRLVLHRAMPSRSWSRRSN